MRREGYELQVSKPKAIMKEIDGVLCEPYEEVTIEAPDDCIGAVIESLGYRRGVLETMDSRDGQTRVVYTIPSRGLFGFMTNFLTMTKDMELFLTHLLITVQWKVKQLVRET